MTSDFVPPNFTLSYRGYEQDGLEISVVGRLKRHIGFWRHIRTSNYLLWTIDQGYRIPLVSCPPPHQAKNNASSRRQPEFVRRAINELIVTGAVQEVYVPPRVINPLTVSGKDGKLRLVLDLRHVNKYVTKQPCKIEGADTLKKFLPSPQYLYGFDLRAGYHHIEIQEDQQQLLGFAYPDHTGRDRFFTYRAMPFGLSSAGFLFTKMLRVLIKHWRVHNIKILAFFYAGLGAAYSLDEAYTHSCVVKTDLIQAGYVLDKAKSIWMPQQIMVWLGFSYDLIAGSVHAIPDKVEKAITGIREVLQGTYVPVTQLSSVVGRITSLYPAYGDIVYLRTKNCQAIVAADADWSRMVPLTPECRSELGFWLTYLSGNNGMPILTPIATGTITYTEIGGTGCATIYTPHPRQDVFVCRHSFSVAESLASVIYREMLCVRLGLEQHKEVLANQSVRWLTESASICSVVRRGSVAPYLLQTALQ